MATKVGKQLEWWFRKFRLAPRILLKYGTMTPERVELFNGVSPVYIDTRDRRAIKKILFDSVRRRYSINRRFWRDFVTNVKPSLALDVGVNYGECIFSALYDDRTIAVGFEANPVLIDYLKRSQAEHPQSGRIHLVNALVGDRPGEEVDFFINESWSGGSTAVGELAETMEDLSKVRVRTVSIDSALNELGLKADRLVFKIDVEGYEPYVLLGMRETLAQAEFAVGFIEVNASFLKKTGWSAARYDAEVLGQFDLYVPESKNSSTYRRVSSLSSYMDELAHKHIHFDLILIKKDGELKEVPEGWSFIRS